VDRLATSARASEPGRQIEFQVQQSQHRVQVLRGFIFAIDAGTRRSSPRAGERRRHRESSLLKSGGIAGAHPTTKLLTDQQARPKPVCLHCDCYTQGDR
jgi:hypothetical protein